MSDTDLIATDAQALEQTNALVSLYELVVNSETVYLHAENTDADIEFDGNTYSAFPMSFEGVELNGDGAQARPTVTMANVESILRTDSAFQGLLSNDFEIDDLVGSRITRRQTLDKYTGTGVTAYEFPADVYVIDRISSKNSLMVQLELTSPFDFGGARVPNRIVTGKYCPWFYKGYTNDVVDVGSACDWASSRNIGGSSYSLFFSIDDEPFVLATLTDITGASAWTTSTSYTTDTIVTTDSGNLYWMAKIDHTSSSANSPNEASTYWKLLRIFTVWSTDTTGTTSYSVNSTDYRRNSYVYHNSNIWRATKAHTKATAIEPGSSPKYWVPGDVCGKLISSCKARYQGTVISGSGTGTSAQASVSTFNTQIALPFGGFPGTRKFR